MLRLNWRDEVKSLLEPIWLFVLAHRGKTLAGYAIFGVTLECGCDGHDLFITFTNSNKEETFLKLSFSGCWHVLDNLSELSVGLGSPSGNVRWVLCSSSIKRIDDSAWNPSIRQSWDETGRLHHVHVAIDGGRAFWDTGRSKYVEKASTTGALRKLPRSIRDLRTVCGERISQKIEPEVLVRDILARADIRGFHNEMLEMSKSWEP